MWRTGLYPPEELGSEHVALSHSDGAEEGEDSFHVHSEALVELLSDVYQLLGHSELLEVCPQQLPIDAVEGSDEVQGQTPYISSCRAVGAF
jgi:hypothetical protein